MSPQHRRLGEGRARDRQAWSADRGDLAVKWSAVLKAYAKAPFPILSDVDGRYPLELNRSQLAKPAGRRLPWKSFDIRGKPSENPWNCLDFPWN
jgi:hypothetical protein